MEEEREVGDSVDFIVEEDDNAAAAAAAVVDDDVAVAVVVEVCLIELYCVCNLLLISSIGVTTNERQKPVRTAALQVTWSGVYAAFGSRSYSGFKPRVNKPNMPNIKALIPPVAKRGGVTPLYRDSN
jgi:hypothetical protein